MLPSRRSPGLANPGPHGFSEILYAYTSATGNNGSAFAGLTANTPFYNTTLGIAMLIGRFLHHRADAGDRRLAGGQEDRARRRPAPSRPTAPLFVGLLVGVILIVGGLTFFPALALGPIVEHFAMHAGNALLRRASMQTMTSIRHRPRPLNAPRRRVDHDRPGDPGRRRIARCVRASSIRAADAQSGDVRRRGRRRADDRPVRPRPRRPAHGGIGFACQIALWLWFTVLFANFAEAVAEGRGKAQADACARRSTDTMAKRLSTPEHGEIVAGVRRSTCAPGDVVLVEAGDIIPGDGEVIEGVASVNEAAITGEVRAGHPREPAATARP